MGETMTVTEPVAVVAERPDTRISTAVRSCRCGQELDVCTRSHCPRCGANLPR